MLWHIVGIAGPRLMQERLPAAGFLLAAIAYWSIHIEVQALLLMLLPLIVDGSVQRLTRYESTNPRRLWTGLLFGFALVYLLLDSVGFAYGIGYRIGIRMKAGM